MREELLPKARPFRSRLFIPGNRPAWMEKAASYGADALILDIEDSVPDQEKAACRPIVKEAVIALKAKEQLCYVRVNGLATGLTLDDLEGVVCPELYGIWLPKVESAADLQELDALLRHLEKRMRIPVGTIETPLVMETAKAMRNAYEIALACPRARTLNLSDGPGGDANRAVGYIWTKEGKETLFLRSKTVLDAKAAGIQYPTITSWYNVKDLAGLEQDALMNRQIGFRGQVLIHPSHVPIVNKVFTPSVEEIAYYKGLIEAMEEAKSKGVAAITYKGDMVDIAMVTTARTMLEFAKSIGLEA